VSCRDDPAAVVQRSAAWRITLSQHRSHPGKLSGTSFFTLDNAYPHLDVRAFLTRAVSQTECDGYRGGDEYQPSPHDYLL
jgi:hypothetical protein